MDYCCVPINALATTRSHKSVICGRKSQKRSLGTQLGSLAHEKHENGDLASVGGSMKYWIAEQEQRV